MSDVAAHQADQGARWAGQSNRHDVAIEHAIEEIERAVGPLTLYQAIDVRRIVERYGSEERCSVLPRCRFCPHP